MGNRNMKLKILLLLVVMLTVGCDDAVYLDNMERETLRYEQLDMKIQKIYEDFTVLEIEKDTVINLIRDIEIDLYTPSLTKNHFEIIFRGFYHVFTVNNSLIMKLKANKGDPFIFYNNALFYSKELNLRESNYRTATYIRIKLDNLLTQ
jgi:hypothetical protein